MEKQLAVMLPYSAQLMYVARWHSHIQHNASWHGEFHLHETFHKNWLFRIGHTARKY